MASQQILLSTKAADIQQGQPDFNHGSHWDIAVRWHDTIANYHYRALIEFDLAQLIPQQASQIVQARLRVSFDGASNYHSDAAYNISCHRITAVWVESQVTWNSRQTGAPWGTAGGDFASPAVVIISSPDNPSGWGTDYFDITQLLKDWLDGTYPHCGVILKCEVESGLKWVQYESDDSTQAEQYKSALVVNYLAPPTAPTGLSVAPNGANRIDLSWTDNSNNETGFKIQRKLGAGGTWQQIDTAGANVTTYTDTAVIGNAAYYYRVCAYNPDGDSAWSNEANATAIQAAPTALSATPSGLTVNLAWTDNATDVTGYKVERKPEGGAYSQIGTAGQNATAYADEGVSPGTHYYRVRAYNDYGNSAYSNEASATVHALGDNLTDITTLIRRRRR
jgi:hypothetical protein